MQGVPNDEDVILYSNCNLQNVMQIWKCDCHLGHSGEIYNDPSNCVLIIISLIKSFFENVIKTEHQPEMGCWSFRGYPINHQGRCHRQLYIWIFIFFRWKKNIYYQICVLFWKTFSDHILVIFECHKKQRWCEFSSGWVRKNFGGSFKNA